MKKRYLLLCGFALSGCTTTAPILGVNNGMLLPCPSTPNCVASGNTHSKALSPIRLDVPPAVAKKELIDIINSLPRTTILKQNDNYLRVEFKTALLGFVDDVEFLLSSDGDNTTRIDFRSASRIGYSDLGANRARMEQIIMLFSQSKKAY
jgi:uncharacterized protein (DUF1499 family)